MNIHEYQTKDLLRGYGVSVPDGRVTHNTDNAVTIAEDLGGDRWVVKAQIHAGGRGKGGGVKVASSLDEVRQFTDDMIGMQLVTPQTGTEGRLVQRVLVEQACDIKKEYYLGMVIDRATQRITMIASASGGMNIEEVAKTDPDRVIREAVDPAIGLAGFQCRKIAARIGLRGQKISEAAKLMQALYKCFREQDALLAEINPLAELGDGRLMALDAKMSFDSNSMYRRPMITELRDFDEEDAKEVEATAHGLNYIALDGNVGCIVNGAGLAMATMDSISFHGGKPANFLDVGGGASPEKVGNAFRIVLQDPNVKIILVNIFAGINRCDWIAEGLVQAMRDQDISVPIVVRLAGTNVEKGAPILEASGFPFIMADNLDDASTRVMATLEAAA
ncbi:MAG: ADP-forming succinate--CoA ligase subunit beta [Gammaproteobacteria bacterium]|nr:ADP-forming succinate--CoA ligase subunit beta [Gammaproteobacteria bacterium]MDH3934924.1 ADP-forming succinate--CoA ligase subunit beta [Gammaproteobacteria bacterium]